MKGGNDFRNPKDVLRNTPNIPNTPNTPNIPNTPKEYREDWAV